MDIRDWPLNKIMQLPDSCFGRRWPIGLKGIPDQDAFDFDIAEAALPERCILWDVVGICFAAVTKEGIVELALGDFLPANYAEFDPLERVLTCMISPGGTRYSFGFAGGAHMHIGDIRMPLAVSGRRFVVAFSHSDTAPRVLGCHCIVSSVPTEVPDWLVCP